MPNLPDLRDAGGNFTKVLGIGTVHLCVKTNRGMRTIVFRDVLYAPDFAVNIISHRQLKGEG